MKKHLTAVPKKRGRPRLTPKSPLTRRQDLFVKELVSKDGQITMREAAINAGFSARSAHTRAYEMTNPNLYPNICARIREYRAELDEKYGVDYKRHLKDLQMIRNGAIEAGAWSAAVMAEYRRGQAEGNIYVNKSEVRHGSIDSMSKEDVMRALKEIKESYAPITIDEVHAEGSHNASNRAKARGRILEAIPDGPEQSSEKQTDQLDPT